MIQAFIRAVWGLWKWETALLSQLSWASVIWSLQLARGDRAAVVFWPFLPAPSPGRSPSGQDRSSHGAGQVDLNARGFCLQTPQLTVVYFSLDLAFIVHPNWHLLFFSIESVFDEILSFFFFFSCFVLFYCLFVCLLWFLLIVSLSPFHFSFRSFSSFLVL